MSTTFRVFCGCGWQSMTYHAKVAAEARAAAHRDEVKCGHSPEVAPDAPILARCVLPGEWPHDDARADVRIRVRKETWRADGYTLRVDSTNITIAEFNHPEEYFHEGDDARAKLAAAAPAMARLLLEELCLYSHTTSSPAARERIREVLIAAGVLPP